MKILISVFLIIVLIVSLGLGIDESAMALQDEAFDRAMIAFGLAKGLNAVISLIQGTELSFTPIGVGLNFSISEVLDPFNDMVERFSWVMLLASVSLGIQKLLLILSAKVFLQVAFGLSIVFSLTLLWLKKFQNSTLISYAFKSFALLLLFRFSAIIFIYISQFFYTTNLAQEYESASVVVKSTKSSLEDIQNTHQHSIQEKKSSSLFVSMGNQYKNFSQSLNLSQQIDKLHDNIEDASRKIITLITIFIVQSLILPLLFLWLFILSFKAIFRANFSLTVSNIMYNNLNSNKR